jgi:hypothetical protein
VGALCAVRARLLLARDPRALTAVGRIFVQEIFRWQRERAALSGLRSTASGAVCFPQRFGGSMNLNVHFHVLRTPPQDPTKGGLTPAEAARHGYSEARV